MELQRSCFAVTFCYKSALERIAFACINPLLIVFPGFDIFGATSGAYVWYRPSVAQALTFCALHLRHMFGMYRRLKMVPVRGVDLLAAAVVMLSLGNAVRGAVFTLTNQCAYTVWPGILTGSGGGVLEAGGLTLSPGQSVGVTAPENWSGRFWGRTGCNFDASGTGSCATGDCGNVLQCNNAGGAPPVTLAEFTLGGQDFYDVSLVDGYNVPLKITAVGGTGDCRTAGCVSDLKATCPAELSVTSNGQTVACKSACDAFGDAGYCCTGDHATPQTCSPTQYSQIFKAACPSAYSYAYDDASSTCTCSNSDYAITFCPSG